MINRRVLIIMRLFQDCVLCQVCVIQDDRSRRHEQLHSADATLLLLRRYNFMVSMKNPGMISQLGWVSHVISLHCTSSSSC